MRLVLWVGFVAALSSGGTARAGGMSVPSPDTAEAPEADFSGHPATADVQKLNPKGEPHPVRARLITDVDVVAPGESFRLGVHLDQAEGWHTYWKTPGEVGQAPTIEWELPDGARIDSDFEFPAPQFFEQSDLRSVGYSDQVLYFVEVSLPDEYPRGELVLGASVGWVVCATSCIPGDAELSLPVVVGDEEKSGKHAAFFDHWESLHPTPPLELEAVAFEPVLSQSALHAEDEFEVAILVTPIGDVPVSFEKEHGDWPFFAPITGSNWMLMGRLTVTERPDGSALVKMKGMAFAGDPLPEDEVYGGLFQFKVGDRWVRTELEQNLPFVAADVETVASTSPLFALGEGTDSVESSADGPAGAPEASAVAEQSMLVMLGFAFLGGLLLNIMPCVLPVLTLKLYGLVEQGDISQRERVNAGLAYTAGIVLSFVVLAGAVLVIRSVFEMPVGWGFQFQYPGYVIALGTIVFVFGLSLFGVFEVPTFGANAMNEASQSKEGVAGYMMTGAFATLLATPCSAPFLGTGMGFAFSLPGWGIVLFFAIAGLGLAFPFLLVAFVPALYAFLPSPGAWMETFKQFLGFTLMATAVWLVDVVGAQTGQDGATGFLAFLCVIAIACWLQGRFGGGAVEPRRQMGVFALALAISIGGGFMFIETEFSDVAQPVGSVSSGALDFSEEIPWQPFSDQAVADAEGELVFVDFTAEWCLTCKVNEKNILETETVRSKMADLGVIPLKADWTRRDEAITRWLQRFGKAGVPFYLVLPADPSRDPIPLPEVITPGLVVNALEEGA